MARMKFLCDADRCIECHACVTACKNEHEVPWGINRRRVVTINDGKPGARSISMACMHCTDAPCAAVCPVNCFYTTADAVVLHSKDLCIGCGYCFYACPFGAPQYPRVGNFGSRGKMDKCTFCAGGPEADGSAAEYDKYGANRLAVLDPLTSQPDAYSPRPVMRDVITILGPTVESPASGGVFEWCINTMAADPSSRSILVNSEDGLLYRWDLATNSFSQRIRLGEGLGQAYTPTAIGADGAVYAINNARVFSVGR